MTYVELVTTNAGKEVSVFTCDQQLYRVTLDIIWTNPERWKTFYWWDGAWLNALGDELLRLYWKANGKRRP